jgi:hypothetical protein
VIINLEKETVANVNPLLPPAIVVDVASARREEISATTTLGEKFCFVKKKPRLTGFLIYSAYEPMLSLFPGYQ